jgi:hypothetical protein
MATLNEMIAQGAQFYTPDPTAQYNKLAQMQKYQQENELARYTMAKAQQEDVTRNALNQAYQSNMNPETGEINYAGVYRNLGAAGAGASIPGIQKTQFEAEQQKQLLAKTRQETSGLQNKAIGSALTTAMSDPSDAGLNQAFDILDRQKIDTKSLRSQLLNIQDPAKRLAAIRGYATAHPEGIAAMKFVAPDPLEITKGDGSKIFVDKNPNSPTFKTEILPSQVAGMTPTQAATVQTGQDQLKVSQDRLAFDRAKLKYEQENPDFKLIESSMPDGTTAYFAVDKAGKAKPITIAGINLTGVNLPAQSAASRLTFDKEKLKYEQENPGFTVQDTANGLVAVNNKNPSDVRPLKIDGKGVISATATASTNRLNFDREKLAWEKANPGYTVRDTADGLVAVNNRDPNDVQPLMQGDKGIISATTDTATKNRISQDLRAAAQLLSTARTAGNRLAFDQTKFAWEKANPGFTVRETDTGLVAVNSKNPTDVRPISVEGTQLKGKPSAFAEKAAAQKVQMGKDLTQAIAELTEVTKDGGLIDQSTGSGAGRLYDVGAGFFGQAPQGAIAIGKLQPIADIALKMVPRFEGPQSDRDTTSYKQAAGQLADPTLPTKIRKEAGKTVLRLMKARKEQFGTVDMVAEGVAPAPAAAAPNIDALLNKYK